MDIRIERRGTAQSLRFRMSHASGNAERAMLPLEGCVGREGSNVAKRSLLGEKSPEAEEHSKPAVVELRRRVLRKESEDGWGESDFLAAADVEQGTDAVAVVPGAQDGTIPGPAREHAVVKSAPRLRDSVAYRTSGSTSPDSLATNLFNVNV